MMIASDLFPAHRTFVSQETYDAFFAVIARLETTITLENAALKASRHGELALFTRQKRQGFLELSRIMHSLAATVPSQDIIARLAEFRKTLDVNDRLLRTYLDAVHHVTDIIIRAMREAESDGCYSRAQAFGNAGQRSRRYSEFL